MSQSAQDKKLSWSIGITLSWPVGGAVIYFILKITGASLLNLLTAPIYGGFIIYCVLALIFQRKV